MSKIGFYFDLSSSMSMSMSYSMSMSMSMPFGYNTPNPIGSNDRFSDTPTKSAIYATSDVPSSIDNSVATSITSELPVYLGSYVPENITETYGETPEKSSPYLNDPTAANSRYMDRVALVSGLVVAVLALFIILSAYISRRMYMSKFKMNDYF